MAGGGGSSNVAEFRTNTVKLKLLLEDKGPVKQSHLQGELDIGPSTMSRFLKKLERSGQICRSRDGTDKIVYLPDQKPS